MKQVTVLALGLFLLLGIVGVDAMTQDGITAEVTSANETPMLYMAKTSAGIGEYVKEFVRPNFVAKSGMRIGESVQSYYSTSCFIAKKYFHETPGLSVDRAYGNWNGERWINHPGDIRINKNGEKNGMRACVFETFTEKEVLKPCDRKIGTDGKEIPREMKTVYVNGTKVGETYKHWCSEKEQKWVPTKIDTSSIETDKGISVVQ
jgi:hypothetical protein